MPPSVPTIVITGATSGIGQRAAIALARQGAHLVLTARSQARAEATIAMIEAVAPGARVDAHYGDFTDMASVAALGSEIAARHCRIDALINNAGIHAFKLRITRDGYSEMVAVNYLAPWLLTNILRDTVIRSAPSLLSRSHRKRRGGPSGLIPSPRSSTNAPFHARLVGDLRPDQIDEYHVFGGIGARPNGDGGGGQLPVSRIQRDGSRA
jgi:NAD(P)-dependent dehydrogenase (short-subunit alcohol dehydrogenase family)